MTPQQQKLMELSLETSKNTLTALKSANEHGAIADTIWLNKYETLFDYIESQIDAMQRILAQPEQEPVAYGMRDTMLGCGGRMMMVRLDKGQDGCTVPLYTTPPQRKPLTDDQMNKIWFEQNKTHGSVIWRFARAIEAAHGIKE